MRTRCALLAGVLAPVAAVGAATAITVTTAPPSVARVGSLVIVRGRLADAPASVRAWLQIRRSGGWRTVATGAPDARHRFTLRWRPRPGTAIGLAHWRVAAARSGRVLAATAPREFAVGAARVRCAAPVPPAVMMTPAEGWIVGGLYFEGGPFPGSDSCSPSAYTITARNAAGAVVARQSVAGGHSYTLVLPAGMYTLETASGTCHGSATVRPAKQTMADTVCYVP